MIKFLDLNTGYSFDGLWTESQQKGYIFWFPKEQSTELVYTMPIVIVADFDEARVLKLSMDENDIFSFIHRSSTKITIDGYEFDGEPVRSHYIELSPDEVIGEDENAKYIYVFNVAAKSNNSGEFVNRIKIDDEGYIRVGADFYCEYEPAYINLSNMGVEIPDTVQKAIYDSNVHEDKTDNILINRKFKELLSNYWDIVANKGSYKSLLNSLEWFEWPNILKIREMWKHQEANRTIFSDDDILTILEDKIEESFSNFAKTSYISLYCSLQNEKSTYDIEYNPELENAVFKWTRNDIHLKIALLAQFFGIYFMPIHTSLLHATAEDMVFTNTIKSIVGSSVKRKDHFGDFNYVECNIKDDDKFKLTNVRAQATANTIYKNKDFAFGVDVFPSRGMVDENSIEDFINGYYGGPGVIVPVNFVIPNQAIGDFVKQTIVHYETTTGIDKRLFLNDIIKTDKSDKSIKINFNMLLKDVAKYTLRFTFIMASGNTVTRRMQFEVEDADNLNINIYKILAKDDSNGFTREDFEDDRCGKYVFKTQNGNTKTSYTQYLPYMLPTDPSFETYKGIKLNRTVIVDLRNKNGLGSVCTDHEILVLRSIMLYHDYLEFSTYDYTDPDNPVMTYLIFVSKKFYAELPNEILSNEMGHTYNIIRNQLGFYPQFHYLEKIDGNTLDDYTIKQHEAICCAAEINNGDEVIDFRYSHLIDDAEWTFFNQTTGETIANDISSIQPFVAKTHNMLLEPGYYDVMFRYSLSNGNTGECKLNSAFRIK